MSVAPWKVVLSFILAILVKPFLVGKKYWTSLFTAKSIAQTTFFFEFDSLITFGLESFWYVFKDNSSCITLPTVVIEQISSLAILFADFRFLFKHTFRLVLAISCFVLTVLGRPVDDLANISPRVLQVYHLYTVALETVLLSLP